MITIKGLGMEHKDSASSYLQCMNTLDSLHGFLYDKESKTDNFLLFCSDHNIIIFSKS